MDQYSQHWSAFAMDLPWGGAILKNHDVMMMTPFMTELGVGKTETKDPTDQPCWNDHVHASPHPTEILICLLFNENWYRDRTGVICNKS